MSPYLTMRRVQGVKVGWAKLGGGDRVWVKMAQCSRARLILGRQDICRETMNQGIRMVSI